MNRFSSIVIVMNYFCSDINVLMFKRYFVFVVTKDLKLYDFLSAPSPRPSFSSSLPTTSRWWRRCAISGPGEVREVRQPGDRDHQLPGPRRLQELRGRHPEAELHSNMSDLLNRNGWDVVPISISDLKFEPRFLILSLKFCWFIQ